MALNFPNAPVRGTVYAAEGQRWYWNDEAWVVPYVGPTFSFLGITAYNSSAGASIVYPADVQAGDLLIHSCISRDNVVPLPEEVGTHFTKIAFVPIPDGTLASAALLAFEVATTTRTGALGGFTTNNNGYSSAIYHFRPAAGLEILSATPRNAVTAFSSPFNNSDPLGPLLIDATPPSANPLDIALGNIGCFTGTVNAATVSEVPTHEYSAGSTNYSWMVIAPQGDVTFTDVDNSTQRKVMCGAVLNVVVAEKTINITAPPVITGTTAPSGLITLSSPSTSDTPGATLTSSVWIKGAGTNVGSTASDYDKDTDGAAHDMRALETWSAPGYPNLTVYSNTISVQAAETINSLEVTGAQTPEGDLPIEYTVSGDTGAAWGFGTGAKPDAAALRDGTDMTDFGTTTLVAAGGPVLAPIADGINETGLNLWMVADGSDDVVEATGLVPFDIDTAPSGLVPVYRSSEVIPGLGTVQTSSALPIGPATDGRHVIVGFTNSGNNNVTGVKIGGVTATERGKAAGSGGSAYTYSAALNATFGTTAVVEITTSASVNDTMVHLLTTPTAPTYGTASTHTGNADPHNTDLAGIVAGGAIIGVSMGRDFVSFDTGDISVTGLSGEQETIATADGGDRGLVSAIATATGTSATIEWDYNGGSIDKFRSIALPIS